VVVRLLGRGRGGRSRLKGGTWTGARLEAGALAVGSGLLVTAVTVSAGLRKACLQSA